MKPRETIFGRSDREKRAIASSSSVSICRLEEHFQQAASAIERGPEELNDSPCIGYLSVAPVDEPEKSIRRREQITRHQVAMDENGVGHGSPGHGIVDGVRADAAATSFAALPHRSSDIPVVVRR